MYLGFYIEFNIFLDITSGLFSFYLLRGKKYKKKICYIQEWYIKDYSVYSTTLTDHSLDGFNGLRMRLAFWMMMIIMTTWTMMMTTWKMTMTTQWWNWHKDLWLRWFINTPFCVYYWVLHCVAFALCSKYL